MSKSNFHKLFELKVSHSYFNDEECTCLSYTPTVNTTELLKRYNFFIRTNKTGFSFYSNISSGNSTYLDYIEHVTGQSYFEFDISSNVESFNLFTDLPIDWLGTIQFDSSSENNSKTNETINLYSNLNSSDDSTFIGKLIIRFEDLQEDEEVDYAINFESRLTQWKYIIINKNQLPLNKITIVGKEGLKFDGPDKIQIQSGEDAILFTSVSKSIPLSISPTYKLDLINSTEVSLELNQRENLGKVIFKGLPNPNPKNFEIVNQADANIVASPMYVYI